jgi:molybdopterin-guanine dinucleotide biosynthesis protein A
MEELICGDRLRIINVLSKVNVREVSPQEIVLLDHSMQSFFNLNTPEDLEKARKMLLTH